VQVAQSIIARMVAPGCLVTTTASRAAEQLASRDAC
jgi:hypothetical protein